MQLLSTKWVISDHVTFSILLALEEIPPHSLLIVPIPSKRLPLYKPGIQDPAQLLPPALALLGARGPAPITSNNSFPPPARRFRSFLVLNAKSAVYVAVL